MSWSNHEMFSVSKKLSFTSWKKLRENQLRNQPRRNFFHLIYAEKTKIQDMNPHQKRTLILLRTTSSCMLPTWLVLTDFVQSAQTQWLQPHLFVKRNLINPFLALMYHPYPGLLCINKGLHLVKLWKKWPVQFVIFTWEKQLLISIWTHVWTRINR